MEVDDEAGSNNSTVISRSRVQTDTAASESNMTDLFGLGAARRDTTRLRNLFHWREEGPNPREGKEEMAQPTGTKTQKSSLFGFIGQLKLHPSGGS